VRLRTRERDEVHHAAEGHVLLDVVVDVERPVSRSSASRGSKSAGAYAGGSGTQAFNTGGYSVYFSDRRNNRDTNSLETGEYASRTS